MRFREERLGDLADIIMGQSPDGSLYNNEGVGLPLITGAGQFGTKFPAPNQWSRSGAKISQVGDILITIRASIGDLNWSDKPYYLGRGVAAIRVGNKLDERFAWRLLESRKRELELLANGSTFKQIKREDVAGITVPLIPLSEQRRIAAILDQADALRAKRRTQIEIAKLLPRAIFLEMFGDPITNTKRWETKRLCELGTVDRGVSKHRPRNAPELLGGPYPLVQTGDVANCDGYVRECKSSYSELGLEQSRMWPAGTLCITIAANIAKTGMLAFSACFPDSVVGFLPDKKLTNTAYVKQCLSFWQSRLES